MTPLLFMIYMVVFFIICFAPKIWTKFFNVSRKPSLDLNKEKSCFIACGDARNRQYQNTSIVISHHYSLKKMKSNKDFSVPVLLSSVPYPPPTFNQFFFYDSVHSESVETKIHPDIFTEVSAAVWWWY